MKLISFILLLVLPASVVCAEYRDYWFDDKRINESLPYEKQLKKHIFKKTDKIDIIINDTLTDKISIIDNIATVKVSIKFDIGNIEKIELTDVLLESVSGYAPEGTIFPTNMALYKVNPKVNLREITSSFKNISVMHLKGFDYSEIVLMVKVRTADGKKYYTVKKIKVQI